MSKSNNRRTFSQCPHCGAPARFDQGVFRHYQCGTSVDKTKGIYEKACGPYQKRVQDQFQEG